jgi:predicted DNA binding CopG/RHH family protein
MNEKGTDLLKAQPAMVFAGSRVDRNASDERQLATFFLDQRLSDRSLLRRVRDDNKNSHRADTEAGLRLMESLLELILKATRKSPGRCTACGSVCVSTITS